MTTLFEIRVEGELAGPTLHTLGCAHCVAGPQTVLRIEATPSALQDLVTTCSEQGIAIESIVRVAPVGAPADALRPPSGQQSPSSRPRRTASTRRFTDSLRKMPRT